MNWEEAVSKLVTTTATILVNKLLKEVYVMVLFLIAFGTVFMTAFFLIEAPFEKLFIVAFVGGLITTISAILASYFAAQRAKDKSKGTSDNSSELEESRSKDVLLRWLIDKLEFWGQKVGVAKTSKGAVRVYKLFIASYGTVYFIVPVNNMDTSEYYDLLTKIYLETRDRTEEEAIRIIEKL
ncbi:MAG: hypothetical protein DSY42_04460 [Aquifex sp.]|nr:MAG: hypothetical protein DSY42_04460 [Aquifex sp.]